MKKRTACVGWKNFDIFKILYEHFLENMEKIHETIPKSVLSRTVRFEILAGELFEPSYKTKNPTKEERA